MVNKYYLTKVYIIQQSHILYIEVYIVYRALCLALIKRADDTELTYSHEHKISPIMTVFAELF